MVINRFWLVFLCPLYCLSQTLTGTILDATSNKPLETVAVYFDNTTVGTTTNEKGEFSISYSDVIQSALVISYLGYEKILIKDYRTKRDFTIKLKPVDVTLDEVYIDFDDGLTRKQKLRLFKKEFLGTSKYGKSCKILNEDNLILRYDKKRQTLYASSNVPIIIKNKALKYQISFDIIDFEANYRYANLVEQDFVIDKVGYTGTSYYKDLENANKKNIERKREKVYKGSVQHFMRSLYNRNLRKEGYRIFYQGLRVKEWDYFDVTNVKDSKLKQVTLGKKVSILFNKDLQSEMELEVDKFYVDGYGNYSPITGVFFSGNMGSRRVGDALPLDYGLE